jgi:hypothetical protein
MLIRSGPGVQRLQPKGSAQAEPLNLYSVSVYHGDLSLQRKNFFTFSDPFSASQLPSFQASKLPSFPASKLPSFQASQLHRLIASWPVASHVTPQCNTIMLRCYFDAYGTYYKNVIIWYHIKKLLLTYSLFLSYSRLNNRFHVTFEPT